MLLQFSASSILLVCLCFTHYIINWCNEAWCIINRIPSNRLMNLACVHWDSTFQCLMDVITPQCIT